MILSYFCPARSNSDAEGIITSDQRSDMRNAIVIVLALGLLTLSGPRHKHLNRRHRRQSADDAGPRSETKSAG